MKSPYPIGTVKLTWIDPDNYNILSGKMFNSAEEAISNVTPDLKSNWLLMELVETDGIEYKWKLLPFGSFKRYKRSMQLTDKLPIALLILTIAVVGIYLYRSKVKK